MDWHDAAQDRDRWQRLEAGFVSKVLRKTPKLKTSCTIVGLWGMCRCAALPGAERRKLLHMNPFGVQE